jgi:hypothetical protein
VDTGFVFKSPLLHQPASWVIGHTRRGRGAFLSSDALQGVGGFASTFFKH